MSDPSNSQAGLSWSAAPAGRGKGEMETINIFSGSAKLHEARPTWERTQERMKGTWSSLLDHLLPELTRLAEGT